MKNTFRDIFNRVARPVQHLVTEMPLKVQTGLVLVGDAFVTTFGTVTDNPLWILAGITSTASNLIRLSFGTGGKWDTSLPPPSPWDIVKFPKEVIMYTVDTFSKQYWKDVKDAIQSASVKDVVNKLKNSWQVHKNPLDASLLGYIACSSCFLADGLNVLKINPGVSPETLAFSIPFIAGSTMAFVTNDNTSAGKLLAASSVVFMAAAAHKAISTTNSGGAYLVAAGLFYLFGDYVFGKVKTDHQSAHHTHKNAEITPPQG